MCNSQRKSGYRKYIKHNGALFKNRYLEEFSIRSGRIIILNLTMLVMLETGTNGFKFQFIPSITNLQLSRPKKDFTFQSFARLQSCRARQHQLGGERSVFKLENCGTICPRTHTRDLAASFILGPDVAQPSALARVTWLYALQGGILRGGWNMHFHQAGNSQPEIQSNVESAFSQ